MARLIRFNKPYGALCQFKASGDEPTLADFIDVPGVYPAGRLDKDSEGLLVLTDDGRLQRRISYPRAVMVGLSGGVDSSVAALLLRKAGHKVIGLFMKNWEEDDDAGYCAAAADAADAQAVADRLGILLHRINFATEYWEQVFAHFLSEYRAGRTPNPDILCNQEIKFGAFLEHALSLGAERIATGHYARVAAEPDGWELRLSADPAKDQTYFLYRLGQEQLGRSLFPLGGLTKAQVRELARRAGLPTAAKRDSTGICFIGERRFQAFLARYIPRHPGPIETADGRVIGEHQGVAHYTIGQRQGLGIGGVIGAVEAPWFVARKDLGRNGLIVVQGHDHPLLMSRGLEATDAHWIAGTPPSEPLGSCHVRLRHRAPLEPCEITLLEPCRFQLRFARPLRAVTPGQAAVLYTGERCLGGGVVADSWS
jgi:tRNA-specific 2-thiouridylase